MPLYEYKCKNCEHSFKKMSSVDSRKDPETVPCTECNETQVFQVIGTPGIVGGVVGAAGLRKPQWFTDKLKDMKKNVGKDNTLGNVI